MRAEFWFFFVLFISFPLSAQERILCAGDSLALGTCFYLQRELDGDAVVDVIGGTGWSIDRTLDHIESFGGFDDYDYVVFWAGINDLVGLGRGSAKIIASMERFLDLVDPRSCLVLFRYHTCLGGTLLCESLVRINCWLKNTDDVIFVEPDIIAIYGERAFDGIHFTANGYRKIAMEVAEEIRGTVCW